MLASFLLDSVHKGNIDKSLCFPENNQRLNCEYDTNVSETNSYINKSQYHDHKLLLGSESERVTDILGQLAAGLVDIEFWEVAELGEDVPPILVAQGD